ncbi:MAG TPA: YciI family protein [Ignavibacteria bacterium]|nr:YciI family protein [Ignavibacteria bacterium]
MSQENPFRVVYALIWKSNKPDDEFDSTEFECRIPRLMEWLKDLKKKGKLVACGGGGFENHAGGLTLINADSIEEAQQLSNGTPMNEIGTTEIMVWDVYYADISEKKQEKTLES